MTSTDNELPRVIKEERPQHPSRSSLLDGLPPDELSRVRHRLRLEHAPAGTILLTQGSWSGRLYLISTGVLTATIASSSGTSHRVARLFPGDSVGEMSLLTGSMATATVTVLADAELFVLEHADFLELMMTCPTLGRNMAAMLSRRLSVANQAPYVKSTRWMRLRVHSAVRSEIAESILHSVAYHLAVTLPVLDYRDRREWRAPGEIPDLQALSALQLPGRRVPGDGSPSVLPIPMRAISSEQHVQLDEWLLQRGGHAAVVTPIEGEVVEPSLTELDYRTDVTLWPADESRPPPHVRDVVLVGSTERENTARALKRSSVRHGARVIRHISPNATASSDDISWIARHLAGLKVGLALGAGGARGYAHLGVIDRMRQTGVPVDYLGGCSIGALVAAGMAVGMSTEHMADELDAAPPHLRRFGGSRHSLLSDQGLRYLYHTRLFGDVCLEDLQIPLAIVAVELLQGRKVVMESGLLWRALMASTSIPGIYPPVWIGDYCLVDGGLLDPVPAYITRTMGADIVFGVRLGSGSERTALQLEATAHPSKGRSPHIVDVMLKSFDTVMTEVTARVVEDSDLTLVADVPSIGLRDFAQGRTFMSAGHEAWDRERRSIETLLPWLNSGAGAVASGQPAAQR